jgi:hypothetical protein
MKRFDPVPRGMHEYFHMYFCGPAPVDSAYLFDVEMADASGDGDVAAAIPQFVETRSSQRERRRNGFTQQTRHEDEDVTWEYRVRNAEEEEESVESVSSPTEEDEAPYQLTPGIQWKLTMPLTTCESCFEDSTLGMSPRLDGMAGSYSVPSSDGRSLWRSCRVCQ